MFCISRRATWQLFSNSAKNNAIYRSQIWHSILRLLYWLSKFWWLPQKDSRHWLEFCRGFECFHLCVDIITEWGGISSNAKVSVHLLAQGTWPCFSSPLRSWCRLWFADSNNTEDSFARYAGIWKRCRRGSSVGLVPLLARKVLGLPDIGRSNH